MRRKLSAITLRLRSGQGSQRSATTFGGSRSRATAAVNARIRPRGSVALQFTALLALTLYSPTMFAATVITTSSIDGGGLHTSSANYTMDNSIGGIDGVSSSTGDTAKDGYIGQLTEVVSVVVTSQPDAVAVSGTAQLSGVATLDDSTVVALGGSDVAWSSPNESSPVFSINSGGLLTAGGFVYAVAPAVVDGYYLGATSNVSLSVFAPDTVGDGIADWWRQAYFGSVTPTNSSDCATCDPDGTGQDNLFKYVAGLNPTSSASVFVLKIAPVTGQPTQKKLTYSPIVVGSGQVYTVQFVTNLIGATYANLTGFSGPTTNGNAASVNDLSATQTSKFYRVNISLP
jgi:hypothetical protein